MEFHPLDGMGIPWIITEQYANGVLDSGANNKEGEFNEHALLVDISSSESKYEGSSLLSPTNSCRIPKES